MNQDDMAHGEIIIVKRGGHGGEEEHHGGVWKIAFADFMTALMAFFLVMWLINASNEKTKKAVASYFNPIKLTDTTTNSKGIKNPKYGVESKDKVKTEEVVTIATPAKIEIKLATQEKKFDEQALFVDPYAILAEIEGGVGKDEGADKQFNSTDPGDGQSMNKGVSFQDPFDPDSWDENRDIAAAEVESQIITDDDFVAEQTNGLEGTETGMMKAEENDFEEVDVADLQTDEVKDKSGDKDNSNEAENIAEGGKSSAEKSGAEVDSEGIEIAAIADKEQAAGEVLSGSAEGEVSQKVTDVATEIKEQLDAALTQSKLTGLDVEVTSTSEGVVVVLSDNNKNGMFTIGSARPTPILVKTMAKLGGVVAEQDGKVEISGHTDGRKYQSDDYDNWRLSSARAHMAYYMLVRGGMEEKRVEKIVGQAAVKLKVPDQPNSAANRRIEILIKPL